MATELDTGREMWLTNGSIIDAVRASVAVPGLVVPFAIRGRWLIDGALVNPLPVSLCRALGADVIIGVSPNGNVYSRGRLPAYAPGALPEILPKQSSWLHWPSWRLPWSPGSTPTEEPAPVGVLPRPGYLEVMSKSFYSAQDFIARVRMAADPVVS